MDNDESSARALEIADAIVSAIDRLSLTVKDGGRLRRLVVEYQAEREFSHV